MAARRRTQEEKNLKTLRELASLPANKQCFDCRQRGPTYVNVTIGSFVCTSCGGILRGLNPPHRVKSITMATFSMEEIEFIKSRGNEYCQYVWMGLYDSRVLEPESRDEQRIRDFMIQKYERKRWYVDPDIATKKMHQDQQQRQNSVPSSSSQSSLVPETQPLSSLLGNNVASLVVQHGQGNTNSSWLPAVTSSTAHQASLTNTKTQSKGHFEFNSFDENVFNNTKSSAEATSANGNFANFESAFNTPALTTTTTTTATTTVTTQSTFHQRKACTPPAGWTSFDDDLDPLRSTSSLPPSSSSSHRQPNVPRPPQSKLPDNGSIAGSTAMPRPLSLPTFSPTNPFSPSSNKLSEKSTPSQWPSFPVTSGATVRPAPSSGRRTDVPVANAPPLGGRPKNESQLNSQPTSRPVQPPPADRYAALADLDNLFHQTPTSGTSNWSASDNYLFGNTVTLKNEGTGNYAGSNPFGTDSLGWNKQPVSQQQAVPTFATANPFQTAVSAPGIVVQPTVAFGASVEEGYAGFGTGVNFATFPTGNVAGSPNGIPTNQFGTQNGFGVRQPVVAWGAPGANVGPWGTGLVNHQNVAQPTFPEAKLEQSASPWMQQTIAANPFLERNGATVPRTKPGNPFL
ncbi:arf-GAP domain and FG repeat-containing protein 1-like isoform X2 [Centruroides sculpturatus]|uniref:arf-GAP domain and FG repeat-containing protein 1-like isoform X2 n=1 Tax=Centruroides sculpturatus TaxID=218467 RepID=UPI000C6DF424|nr:arf-GAP domain and FG repeat-containing protein 1-like isoform X2 [Centruroides sculpturatus]